MTCHITIKRPRNWLPAWGKYWSVDGYLIPEDGDMYFRVFGLEVSVCW